MADARTAKEVLIESLFRDSDEITTRQERIVEQLEAQTEMLPVRFASQARNEIAPLIGEVKAAIAQASDNIEAGIVQGAATALVEVNQTIDKLIEQASLYEAKSAELEKGLGQLVHNFQKSANEIVIHEVVTLSDDLKAAGATFRQRMVDDQERALTAIVEAKTHQTWGAVWQFGFALAIGLLGGFVGANLHAVSTNNHIANLERLIMEQQK